MAFIIKPLITEKMNNITEKSSVDRTYKAKTGKHRGEEVTKKAQPKYGFIVSFSASMALLTAGSCIWLRMVMQVRLSG